MTEKILFLTGRLAERSLNRVLETMQPTDFAYEVRQLGASVAALMTPKLIEKRLDLPPDIDRVMLPGRMRGDLEALEAKFGVPFERGPDELKDLPTHFGRVTTEEDLSRYDVQIFAEITEAPNLSMDAILAQARHYQEEGADIIDIGCLPGIEFPHLADTVKTLKREDFLVSVDSLETENLILGGQAGADFLLSLQSDSLWVADEVDSIPVLIGNSNTDLESLCACVDHFLEKDRPFIADPILDPIHFGCADSIARYVELRRRYPDIEILMGVGNLTELTHADTAGMNALLFGLISELSIRYTLTTQVSEHCRTSLREADRARRIMRVAAKHGIPPKGIDDQLMMLHERHPYPYNPEEIAEFAAQVKDRNFRIRVAEDGVHLYNRDGEIVHTDPLDFYEDLDLDDDPGHLYYLGIELTRAQIAWQLGKRYEQDEEFLWGCAVRASSKDLSEFRGVGPTRQKRKEKMKHRKS